MSTTTNRTEGEQAQSGLFGDGDLVEAAGPTHRRRNAAGGAPRVMSPQRNQIELRPCDLESVLAADHPARTVWLFVQALDLGPLYARIKSVDGSGGAPAIDPAILVALWLWATIDGVGSARELDRLCERDDAYRWICGGVGVNYHTLADFRAEQAQWLDDQLTRSIAALLERKLVTLNVLAQDGLRVRASAKAASFRRKEKLAQLHGIAKAQVHALKRELNEDAGASSRRKQAARERAAREREQRLAQALATMDKIEGAKPKPRVKPRGDNDDPPDPGNVAKPAPEPRVSTTDPESRVMKMADGGFRPAFNAQLAVDTQTQLIAAVDVVNCGTDMGQMAPMHQSVQARYGLTPAHWLADGGYTKLQAIEDLTARGTQPVVPPPASRNPDIDPLAPKETDSLALRQWRNFMASDHGRTLYLQRGATVECANAQVRRRGLARFLVRGLLKTKAVLLWHALAHNLMRMRSLGLLAAA